MSTEPDPHAREWQLTDSIVRLREWGTDNIYPVPDRRALQIGSAHECDIRIVDRTRRVSRRHATFIHGGDSSYLCDSGSRNGTRLDGASRAAFVVEPGSEIGLGGVTLIAESKRSIALRRYLARILGWTGDRVAVIDHALRAVRMAVTGRAPLTLSSVSDPVAIAHEIHRIVLGDRPFICCDPRRGTSDESVRSVRNIEDGDAAFAAASGGTVCAWATRLPKRFEVLRSAWRAPEPHVMVVLCTVRSIGPGGAAAIVVPSLSGRTMEVTRIVEEYAEDARVALGAAHESFRQSDRAWIVEHASKSLSTIETTTTRLIALRHFGNLNRAATKLGMARVSLDRWVKHNRLPWRETAR